MEKFNDQLYGNLQFKNRPLKVYEAYARAVWEIFQPESILDLGCANAYALSWWQQQGIQVSGVEAAAAAFKFMPKPVRPFVQKNDLRKPLKLSSAEVVNFTEVAEHINKKYEKVMLRNVLQAVKKYLIISWSNEANEEHVNPHSLSDVKRKINLFFEPELTAALKQKLKLIRAYPHWHKNILVFSKIPQKKRVLIRHYEWLLSYQNKNIGYFQQAATALGLGPVWVSNTWQSLFKTWHRVWLYPFEKHLLLKLVILKIFGNQIILKMDSVIFPVWRARLIQFFCDYILVESTAVARPFSKKVVYFSGGLPQKNIALINQIKVKRQKIILFCGRPTWQKGIDRFKKLRLPGWKFKIISDLPPADYYREIKKSSLVVLPTRGEGWPNVFQDAWFCRRLFLSTTKARCLEGILNPDFYQDNLQKAILKITRKLDWYYKNYSQLYNSAKFVQTDKIFFSLLKNAG